MIEVNMEKIEIMEELQNDILAVRRKIMVYMESGDFRDEIIDDLQNILDKAWREEKRVKAKIDAMVDAQYERIQTRGQSNGI